MNNLQKLQNLLRKKADLNARLNLLPYEGTPEIKTVENHPYLYIRHRINGKLQSVYVGKYTEELHGYLLRTTKEARNIRKELRQIDQQLASLNYCDNGLTPEVQRNLDFARANLKANIYDQAVLEGVGTTFIQTEEILNNGIVNGVSVNDIQKILNLKHAWEFILDKDILQCPSDFYLLSHIAYLVNEHFFEDGGKIRNVPVNIGGTSYSPPLPWEADIKESIQNIITNVQTPSQTAIKLCLYCMRTQIFLDGNKRASVIFANQYLISHGAGLLIIPETEVTTLKKLLVKFYETNNDKKITAFMLTKCLKTMNTYK